MYTNQKQYHNHDPIHNIDAAKDEVISNDIFFCDLILIDENRKFGKKGKGRKRHKVKMNQRLFPDKHQYQQSTFQVYRNKAGDFYVKNIALDDLVFTGQWDEWIDAELQLKIYLKKDTKIIGYSDPFMVPESEKIEIIDNGVMCCCGATQEQKADYGNHDENIQSRKSRKNKLSMTVY